MYIHTSIPIIRYIFFLQFGAVVKTIQTITNKSLLHNGNDKANTRTGDGKQPRNIHSITSSANSKFYSGRRKGGGEVSCTATLLKKRPAFLGHRHFPEHLNEEM